MTIEQADPCECGKSYLKLIGGSDVGDAVYAIQCLSCKKQSAPHVSRNRSWGLHDSLNNWNKKMFYQKSIEIEVKEEKFILYLKDTCGLVLKSYIASKKEAQSMVNDNKNRNDFYKWKAFRLGEELNDNDNKTV